MRVYSLAYIGGAMWEIVPERLMAAMRRAKLNQSQLATAVGVKQPSIGRLISGETKQTRYLNAIADVLKTTPEDLCGRPEPEDEKFGRAIVQGSHSPEPSFSDTGLVMVKEFDLALGLGGTYLDSPAEEREIPFPADWLRQFSSASPALLHFVRGKGDSMFPTIIDGDICLLDTSRRSIDEQDALWAVTFGDLGMIKRLRRMSDGSVTIMSDNPSVRPEVASDGELYILGRCCGVFRKT